VTNEILVLQDIWAGYDPRIDILKDISLRIQKGEITSIIGSNGAGKSTLFRVIFGFLRPRKGEVYFDGERITHLTPRERLAKGVSYCPQGRCNFPLMTVRENLEMGAYSRSDTNVNRDIDEAMDRFPILAERRRELAGNLSGGEQQLLEMAMALLLHPKLLLLDEPSLGLAPIMNAMVFEDIKKIRSAGTTVILIEQNAKRSLQISDKAFVVRLGQVALEGAGEAMLNDPNVKKAYLGG
jgi:branched-chain amino acid transport system ATP-binding protein